MENTNKGKRKLDRNKGERRTKRKKSNERNTIEERRR